MIVAEVIPTSELSTIMGIASAINGIANFCVAQFFPIVTIILCLNLILQLVAPRNTSKFSWISEVREN